ncbi:MAG: dihydrofolate reductase, partial [Candidatus Puniceispirillum sp.]
MTAVVAMAENRVIGDGKGLIWHIPDDLKRVKTLTMGCPLIMGRKTWDSIGRPLPGRASIVMTRDANWAADGAIRVATMTAAIAAARDWIEATAEARPEIILFG